MPRQPMMPTFMTGHFTASRSGLDRLSAEWRRSRGCACQTERRLPSNGFNRSPDTPHFGDQIRLQQVVWNLLTNAVKFTAQGGEVRTGIRHDGSHIVLTVSDSGQGIEQAFVPFVFDMFRQAHEELVNAEAQQLVLIDFIDIHN